MNQDQKIDFVLYLLFNSTITIPNFTLFRPPYLKDNVFTLLGAIDTYGGNLKVRTTPVRCEMWKLSPYKHRRLATHREGEHFVNYKSSKCFDLALRRKTKYLTYDWRHTEQKSVHRRAWRQWSKQEELATALEQSFTLLNPFSFYLTLCSRTYPTS